MSPVEPPEPPPHVTVVFAGTSHSWAKWIESELARAGCEVSLVRWDPLRRAPAVSAITDFLQAPGKVLLVLADWYLRFDTGRSRQWADVLRQVMPAYRDRIGTVSVTTRPLPPEAVTLGAATLRGVGPEEARHRLLSAVGVAAGQPVSLERALRFPEYPPAVDNSPDRNAKFTGREELLAQLHDALAEDDSGTRVVLYGPPGVGKTQVAAEYTRRFAGGYDLVWWVHAGTKAGAREAFAGLAAEVGLGDGDQLAGQIEAVRRALEADRSGRWLIVFDSADDPAALAGLLPKGRGHVLITAHSADWMEQGAQPIELGSFERDESIAFACRRCLRLTEEQAGELGETLQDLPLLIDQITAWIDANKALDIPDYLQNLKHGDPNDFGVVQSPDAPPAFQVGWAITLGSLERHKPDVYELLTLLAFFSPDVVPVWLLRSARARDLPPHLARLVGDTSSWNAALRTISEVTSMRLDYDTDPRRDTVSVATLRMHRIFHRFVRSNLPPEAIRRNAAIAANVLVASDPREPGSPLHWTRYAELLPHLEPSGALDSQDEDVRELVLNCIEYLRTRGEYQDGWALARTVLDRWREAYGPTERAVLVAAHQEADMLCRLARYEEAETAGRAILDRLTAVPGARGIEVLRAKNGLGGTLLARAKYAEAQELYQEAAQNATDWLGSSQVPRTLEIRSNLALALGLRGRYRESYDLHRALFDDRVGLMGPRDQRTLNSGLNTAWMLRLLGELREARGLADHNAQLHRQVLDRNHTQTLQAEHNLALCLRRDGNQDSAEALMRSVRDRLIRRRGSTHPEALHVSMDYAMLLRAIGNPHTARALAEETAETYAATLGAMHPYAIGARNNCALMELDEGRTESALRGTRKSMEELDRTIGRDHVWAVGAALNCAAALAAGGAVEEAAALGRDAIGRAAEAVGARHVLALNLMAGLAQDLHRLGETEEAAELERQAREALEAAYGPRHRQVEYMRSGQRPYWDFEPQLT